MEKIFINAYICYDGTEEEISGPSEQKLISPDKISKVEIRLEIKCKKFKYE